MTQPANRADKFNKLFKIARKHYQPILAPSNRSVLEHLVYACCLEDSTYEAADEVLAKLLENYFDWNEIRVTTSLELAEMMKGMHDPLAAANRLRKALHGLFESKYTFDAEFLKKENLGKAIEQLEKYKGVSQFGVASVAQLALGGHSIPVDRALLTLMYTVGAITDEELSQGKIPGLERTIPKNKGPEFASVVHQLAVEFLANPHDKKVRDVLLQIDPTAADRFPKRGGGRKKAEPQPAKPTPAATGKGLASAAKHGDKPAKSSPAEKGKKPLPPTAKSPPKKEIAKTTKSKTPVRKAPPQPSPDKKKSATKTLARKKPR